MVVMWYHGSRLWYAVAVASMLPCQRSKRTVGYLVQSLQENGSPKKYKYIFLREYFANQVTCQLSSFIEKIYSVCKSKIEGGQPRNQ